MNPRWVVFTVLPSRIRLCLGCPEGAAAVQALMQESNVDFTMEVLPEPPTRTPAEKEAAGLFMQMLCEAPEELATPVVHNGAYHTLH